MIYIVTDGEYSDYKIEDVLERSTPISEAERELMSQAYKECGGDEWASVLCDKFGFKKVAASELWGGVVLGIKGRAWVVRECSLSETAVKGDTLWESETP